MHRISEKEFASLCRGIRLDAESIVEHNPIGTREVTLLWMLLGVLINYLSLSELETPCFTGTPDSATYRDAIAYIVTARRSEPFDVAPYLDEMTSDAD
ncbi:MAG: hypothetical protein H0V76_04980 [Blastocatellia bacterium]|nr:hypothetical protein [Blastocatellia bacterium]